MNKRFLSTTLALTIGFSSFGMVQTAIQPIQVEVRDNKCSEQRTGGRRKADQLIQTGKSNGASNIQQFGLQAYIPIQIFLCFIFNVHL